MYIPKPNPAATSVPAESASAPASPANASPTKAAAVLYGGGNSQISDTQIRAFINQPGMSDEQVLQAAVAKGINVSQIVRAMAGNANYTLDKVNSFAASQGIAPTQAVVDPLDFRGESLQGAGNKAISDEQIRAYINQPGMSDDKVLQTALDKGVSAQQIAQAMSGNPAFSLSKINSFIASQGIAPRDESKYADLHQSVLYGEGNAKISDAQIRGFVSQPGVSTAQVLNAALANGVSAAQIARAMDGQAGYSLEAITNYAVSQGKSSDTRAATLYGSGNAKISAAEIQAYIRQPGMSGDQVLKGALANGVSAEQIALAMAGDPAFTLANINKSLSAVGISTAQSPADPLDFRAETLFGQGNAKVSAQEIKDFISQPGVTAAQVLDMALQRGVSAAQIAQAMVDPRAQILYGAGNSDISEAQIRQYIGQPDMSAAQVLEAALTHGVSAEQIAQALKGRAGYSLTEVQQYISSQGIIAPADRPEVSLQGITQYIAEQGIATERNPQRYVNLQNSALYGAGNAAISDEAIRAYIYQPSMSDEQVLNAALANGVSIGQITRAMNGHIAYEASNLNDYVGFKGDISALEVLVDQQNQLLQSIRDNPSYEGSREVMQGLREALADLDVRLQSARDKVDARFQQGQALSETALKAEANLGELKAQLEPLHTARLQAEARINGHQVEVDTAQAEVTRLQGVLSGLQQTRIDANGIGKKSTRHYAQGEADRAIVVAQTALDTAQQSLSAAQAGLAQAQTEGTPAIQAAQAAQPQWDAAFKEASDARTRADIALGAGGRAATVEIATKQVIGFDQLNLLEVGQVKSGQLQAQIDAGKLSPLELTQALGELTQDIEEATGLVQKIETAVLTDRARESEMLALAVPVQTRAYGEVLIANNLQGDAQALGALSGPVSAEVQVAQSEFEAASQRLSDAKLAHSAADFAVDWNQGRKNVKNAAKGVAATQPALDAAKIELDASQQAFDVAKAKLESLKRLNGPLSTASGEANYVAGSAAQNARVLSGQANNATGWANLAQNLYNSSDELLAIAQVGVIEGNKVLGQVLNSVAQNTSDKGAAQALEVEAGNKLAWADEYAGLVSAVRGSTQTTRGAQATQDSLAVQAGGMERFSQFLQGKVEHVSAVYEQTKTDLARLEGDFQGLAQQVEAAAPVADQARTAMGEADLESAYAFTQTRPQPKRPAVSPLTMIGAARASLLEESGGTGQGVTNEKVFALAIQMAHEETERQQALDVQLSKPEFVEQRLNLELAGRTTTRKQLHLLDDLELYKGQDPAVLAARQYALDTARALEQASAAAVAAGDNVQVGITMTGLRGQSVLGAQTQLQQATAVAAELGAQAGNQGQVLANAAQGELRAVGNLIQGLSGYAERSNAGATALSAQAGRIIDEGLSQLLSDQASHLKAGAASVTPMVEHAQAAGEAASKVVANAMASSASWVEFTDTMTAWASKELKNLEAVNAAIGDDNTTLESLRVSSGSKLGEVSQVKGYADLAIQEHSDRNDYTKELREDRQSMDAAHKRAKKGSFLKMIVGAVIAVAVTVASMGAAAWAGGMIMGTTLGTVGSAVAMGVGAAAGSAISQGINNGLGLQEGFSVKNVLLSGASAGLTRGLLGVSGGMTQGVASGLARAGATSLLSEAAIGHAAMGLTGAAINTGVQGAMTLAGLQEKFDWSQVASVGLATGLGAAIRSTGFNPTGPAADMGPVESYLRQAAENTGVNLLSNLIAVPTLGGTGTPDWFTNGVLANSLEGGDMGGSDGPVRRNGGFDVANNPGFRTSGAFEVHPSNLGSVEFNAGLGGRPRIDVTPTAMHITPSGLDTPRPAATQISVAQGQTLSGLAQTHGLSIQAIAAANGLNNFHLLENQHLMIPGAEVLNDPAFIQLTKQYDAPLKAYNDNYRQQQQSLGQGADGVRPTASPETPTRPLFQPEGMRALFGPIGEGGLPTPDLYNKATVEAGQQLQDVAQKYGVPAAEIAAATGLKDFYLEAGQELIIPGERARLYPEFKAVADHYAAQYTQYQGGAGSHIDSNARPPIEGVNIASNANYQNVIGANGIELTSTKIHLDAEGAQLQRQATQAVNQSWLTSAPAQPVDITPSDANHVNVIGDNGVTLRSSEIHLSAQDALRQQALTADINQRFQLQIQPTDGQITPLSGANYANVVGERGIELQSTQIHLDPQDAQRQREATQYYNDNVFSKGRNDLGLSGNRFSAAADNYHAGLWGVVEAGAGALGARTLESQMRELRIRNEAQAAQAGQRASELGAIDQSSDIHSLSDLGNYVAGLGIGSVPYLAEVALGGVTGGATLGARLGAGASAAALLRARALGGTAGAVTGSYPSSVGDILQSQRDQNGNTHLGAASALGVLYAGANAFGIEGAIARGTLLRNTTQALDGLGGVSGGAVRAGATGLRNAGVEGGSEMFQESMNQLGRTMVDDSERLFSDRYLGDLKEAGIGGATLGALFGGAGGGWRRSAGFELSQAQANGAGRPTLELVPTAFRPTGLDVQSALPSNGHLGYGDNIFLGGRTGTYGLPEPVDGNPLSGGGGSKPTGATVDAPVVEQRGHELDLRFPGDVTATFDAQTGRLSMPLSAALNPRIYDAIANVAREQNVAIKTVSHGFDSKESLSNFYAFLGSPENTTMMSMMVDDALASGKLNDARLVALGSLSNATDSGPALALQGKAVGDGETVLVDLYLDKQGEVRGEFAFSGQGDERKPMGRWDATDLTPRVNQALDVLLKRAGFSLPEAPDAGGKPPAGPVDPNKTYGYPTPADGGDGMHAPRTVGYVNPADGGNGLHARQPLTNDGTSQELRNAVRGNASLETSEATATRYFLPADGTPAIQFTLSDTLTFNDRGGINIRYGSESGYYNFVAQVDDSGVLSSGFSASQRSKSGENGVGSSLIGQVAHRDAGGDLVSVLGFDNEMHSFRFIAPGNDAEAVRLNLISAAIERLNQEAVPVKEIRHVLHEGDRDFAAFMNVRDSGAPSDILSETDIGELAAKNGFSEIKSVSVDSFAGTIALTFSKSPHISVSESADGTSVGGGQLTQIVRAPFANQGDNNSYPLVSDGNSAGYYSTGHALADAELAQTTNGEYLVYSEKAGALLPADGEYIVARLGDRAQALRPNDFNVSSDDLRAYFTTNEARESFPMMPYYVPDLISIVRYEAGIKKAVENIYGGVLAYPNTDRRLANLYPDDVFPADSSDEFNIDFLDANDVISELVQTTPGVYRMVTADGVMSTPEGEYFVIQRDNRMFASKDSHLSAAVFSFDKNRLIDDLADKDSSVDAAIRVKFESDVKGTWDVVTGHYWTPEHRAAIVDLPGLEFVPYKRSADVVFGTGNVGIAIATPFDISDADKTTKPTVGLAGLDKTDEFPTSEKDGDGVHALRTSTNNGTSSTVSDPGFSDPQKLDPHAASVQAGRPVAGNVNAADEVFEFTPEQVNAWNERALNHSTINITPAQRDAANAYEFYASEFYYADQDGFINPLGGSAGIPRSTDIKTLLDNPDWIPGKTGVQITNQWVFNEDLIDLANRVGKRLGVSGVDHVEVALNKEYVSGMNGRGSFIYSGTPSAVFLSENYQKRDVVNRHIGHVHIDPRPVDSLATRTEIETTTKIPSVADQLLSLSEIKNRGKELPQRIVSYDMYGNTAVTFYSGKYIPSRVDRYTMESSPDLVVNVRPRYEVESPWVVRLDGLSEKSSLQGILDTARESVYSRNKDFIASTAQSIGNFKFSTEFFENVVRHNAKFEVDLSTLSNTTKNSLLNYIRSNPDVSNINRVPGYNFNTGDFTYKGDGVTQTWLISWEMNTGPASESSEVLVPLPNDVSGRFETHGHPEGSGITEYFFSNFNAWNAGEGMLAAVIDSTDGNKYLLGPKYTEIALDGFEGSERALYGQKYLFSELLRRLQEDHQDVDVIQVQLDSVIKEYKGFSDSSLLALVNNSPVNKAIIEARLGFGSPTISVLGGVPVLSYRKIASDVAAPTTQQRGDVLGTPFSPRYATTIDELTRAPLLEPIGADGVVIKGSFDLTRDLKAVSDVQGYKVSARQEGDDLVVYASENDHTIDMNGIGQTRLGDTQMLGHVHRHGELPTLEDRRYLSEVWAERLKIDSKAWPPTDVIVYTDGSFRTYGPLAPSRILSASDLKLIDLPETVAFRLQEDGIATVRWTAPNEADAISVEQLAALRDYAISQGARRLQIELNVTAQRSDVDATVFGLPAAQISSAAHYDFATGARADRPGAPGAELRVIDLALYPTGEGPQDLMASLPTLQSVSLVHDIHAVERPAVSNQESPITLEARGSTQVAGATSPTPSNQPLIGDGQLDVALISALPRKQLYLLADVTNGLSRDEMSVTQGVSRGQVNRSINTLLKSLGLDSVRQISAYPSEYISAHINSAISDLSDPSGTNLSSKDAVRMGWRLLQEGYSEQWVETNLGVTRSDIDNLEDRMAEAGIVSVLTSSRFPQSKLELALRAGPPSGDVWGLEQVRSVIENEFNIKLTPESVVRFLNETNLSSIVSPVDRATLSGLSRHQQYLLSDIAAGYDIEDMVVVQGRTKEEINSDTADLLSKLHAGSKEQLIDWLNGLLLDLSKDVKSALPAPSATEIRSIDPKILFWRLMGQGTSLDSIASSLGIPLRTLSGWRSEIGAKGIVDFLKSAPFRGNGGSVLGAQAAVVDRYGNPIASAGRTVLATSPVEAATLNALTRPQLYLLSDLAEGFDRNQLRVTQGRSKEQLDGDIAELVGNLKAESFDQVVGWLKSALLLDVQARRAALPARASDEAQAIDPRIAVWRMVQEQLPRKTIARATDVSPTTIREWTRVIRREGPLALLTQQLAGKSKSFKWIKQQERDALVKLIGSGHTIENQSVQSLALLSTALKRLEGRGRNLTIDSLQNLVERTYGLQLKEQQLNWLMRSLSLKGSVEIQPKVIESLSRNEIYLLSDLVAGLSIDQMSVTHQRPIDKLQDDIEKLSGQLSIVDGKYDGPGVKALLDTSLEGLPKPTSEEVKAFDPWVLAWRLMEQNTSVKDISNALSVDPRTVRGWRRSIDADGVQSFLSKPRGAVGQLSATDIGRLRELLELGPTAYGFKKWTLQNISAAIKNEFNVSFSIVHVGKILSDAGLSDIAGTQKFDRTFAGFSPFQLKAIRLSLEAGPAAHGLEGEKWTFETISKLLKEMHPDREALNITTIERLLSKFNIKGGVRGSHKFSMPDDLVKEIHASLAQGPAVIGETGKWTSSGVQRLISMMFGVDLSRESLYKVIPDGIKSIVTRAPAGAADAVTPWILSGLYNNGAYRTWLSERGSLIEMTLPQPGDPRVSDGNGANLSLLHRALEAKNSSSEELTSEDVGETIRRVYGLRLTAEQSDQLMSFAVPAR